MREIFKRNLGYKVVSLILALLFWLWLGNQSTTQGLSGDQTLTIPLVLRNQPTNIIVMSKLPPVHVRLQGNNPNVNVKDLFAYVDLSGSTPGDRGYAIQMDPQPQIKVLDLQPSTLNLQLDSVQEKVLPVQVNVTGVPADGFEIGNPIVRPAAVNVRGPGSILSILDKAIVEVSLTGASETMQYSRPILFRDKSGKPVYGPDPSVDVLSSSPSSVDVIVPVQAKDLASKNIPIKVTTKGTLAQGMVVRSVLPSPGSVQLFGTPSALKGFDSLTLGPLDITNLKEDKVFPISSDKVALPTGVSFAAPTTVSIVVQIGPGPVEKTITSLPVSVKNLPPGIDPDQQIAPISITVRGLSDAIKNATPDQIQLWVDATGLAAGSYPNTQVYWQLPAGVEMVTPPQVTLVLKVHKTQ
ncbi:MAG: CdaR family protein [Desulfitobacteriaceae bacterium]